MILRLRKYLFLFFILIFSGLVFGQTTPYYLKNYNAHDYNGYNSIWCTTQDNNGSLYFAGTSAVYVFDGTKFQEIPVKPGCAIRQIVVDSISDIIYIGTVGEFGYLRRDSINGKLIFKSMTGDLNVNQKKFSDIWKIIISNGKTYFLSNERIFICQNQKVIGIIEAPAEKGFGNMFQVNSKIYVRQKTVGLMELSNDKLKLCSGGARFSNLGIKGIIPWRNGQNVILSADSGIFTMTPGTPNSSLFRQSPFKTDSFLLKGGVNGFKWVNDSTIGIFSRTGISFYDADINFVEKINKTDGLGDELIHDIFIDKQKNLWAVHNDGFTKISYNSPALYYVPSNSGFSGNITWLTNYHNELWISTTDGLFVKDTAKSASPANVHFTRLPGLPHIEVLHFLTVNDFLFIGTGEGLYYSHDNKVDKISDNYVNRICASPNPNEFLTLEKGGISVFSCIAGEEPKLIHHFDFIEQDILSAGKINCGAGKNCNEYEFWAYNRFKKIMHITLDLADTKWVSSTYDTLNGLPTEHLEIVLLGDSTYFFSESKAYRYVPSLDKGTKSKCFICAPEIFDLLFDGSFSQLKSPVCSSLELQKLDNPFMTFFGTNSENQFFRSRVPVNYCFGGNQIQFTYAEPNGISWVSSGSVMLKYNSTIKPPGDIPFNTIITNIVIGEDSAIFFGSDKINFRKAQSIPYSYNTILFKFSSPYYEFDNETSYYYQLEGLDTNWTLAKTKLEKRYLNLPEGNYTFKVKMQNLLGHWSSVGSYSFTILPPWYRTYGAYFFYVLLFSGVIFSTAKLSVRRLKKAKVRLEQIVTDRTVELVQQKLLVEEKHKEIKDSINYAERIQRSFLASEEILRKQLKNYFIFFKPKDVVSGDFYWSDTLSNGKFALATADSTGHGVPGAIMSILNISCLERVCAEGISDPGEILDRTRKYIIERLKKDGTPDGGKDGMDASLIIFDFENNRFQYAAAHNPILIVRNSKEIELSPDKMPVGKHELDNVSFKSNFADLKNGDMIYTFTDGFSDQFGGPKGKKFMSKKLKELLCEISILSCEEQKSKLSSIFDGWKGNNEQVDDVLLIGIRFNESQHQN